MAYSQKKKKRVLVVEDEAVAFVLVAHILKVIDPMILVEWCDNVNAAEVFIESHGVSLVISDHNLRGAQTGMDLWRTVTDKYPRLPFLMITGMNIGNVLLQEGLETQPPYILQKPLDVRATRTILEKVLRLIEVQSS